MKKKKEICASFAVAIAKIRATVCDKCLVKVKKALNMWVADMKMSSN